MDPDNILHGAVAYNTLREAILKGRLAAGSRLVTQRIATEMGLSRTPVKEALARLETEGLVTRADNWGYGVRTISLRDAEEIFEARLVIEVASAWRAAERATEAEAAGMVQLLSVSRSYLKARELAEFQNASRAIHELIAQATGNTQLMRMFRQVNDLVVLFGMSLLRANPARATAILAENEAIVEAIQRRHADQAARLMREHIENGHAGFRATAAAIRPAMAVF